MSSEKKSTHKGHGNKHSTEVDIDSESDKKKRCSGCNECRHGFNGAGILVLVPSRFDSKKKDVLLAKSANTNKYNDFGGSFDRETDARLSVTASREAREESLGLIDIEASTVSGLMHFNIWRKRHAYRCYLLDYSTLKTEPPITPSKFKAARTAVKTLIRAGVKVPHHFIEMKSIGRFPLDEIVRGFDSKTKTSYVNLNQKTWNDEGNYVDVILHSRVARILNRVLDMNAKRS